MILWVGRKSFAISPTWLTASRSKGVDDLRPERNRE